MTRSADGRFEIHVECTDDDSYMHSDTDYSFHVAIVETGDEIAQFGGREFRDAGGSRTWGVQSVAFEGNAIVARHYDGKVERLELPVRVAIVDEGQLELTYASGRTERRARKPVTGHMKYGQPYAITKLME